MRKLAITGVVLMFLCLGGVPAAFADSTVLQSSAITINGTSYVNDLSDAGAGISSSGGITVGGSTYGQVTVTVSNTGSSTQSFSVDGFFDPDLSLPFYNEYANVNGSPASGQSWEVGDYTFSSIVSDALAESLNDTNGLPPGTDNSSGTGTNGDVAVAMQFDFSLEAGQTETVTFDISSSNPGGFNIDQVHPVDETNGTETDAFFSGSAVAGSTPPPCESCTPPPSGMPEPSSLWMLGASLCGLLSFRWKRSGK